MQEGIIHYSKQKAGSVEVVDSEKGVLDRVKFFFESIPKDFSSALKNINVDINIQGLSDVRMNDLLPATKNKVENSSKSKDLQSMIYSYLNLVKILQNQGEIVIYGSGSGTDFMLPHIVNQCKFIIDINKNIHGNKVMGILILGIEALSSYTGTVVVTVLGRKNQILATLSNFNVEAFFIEDYL